MWKLTQIHPSTMELQSQPQQPQASNKLLSLHEAIHSLEEEGKGTRKWTGNGAEITYSSTELVDLLVVVTRLSVHSSDPPSAELWITDSSLDNKKHVSVVVTLHGTAATQKVQEQKLAPVGSIIRFNGLTLNRKNIVRGNDKKSKPTLTYELKHSWKNPQAGAQWHVLGHVSGGKSYKTPFNSARMPSEMETDPTQVQDLIQWCQQQSKWNLDPLPPVPCQKSYLEDVVSSLGVISNVTVMVTNLETISEATIRARKRKRISPSSSNGRRKLLLATVSDGRRTQVTFLCGENKRLQGKLNQAYQSDQLLLLNSVVCRKGRTALPGWLDEEDWNEQVFLATTKETSIVLVQPKAKRTLLWDQSQTQSSAGLAQHTQVPFSDTQPPNQYSQPPPVFSPASQTQPPTSQQQQLSQPQHFFTATQPTSQIHEDKTPLVLEASLDFIYFPDQKRKVKKGDRVLQSPRKLLAMLMDGHDYRPAVLGLDAKTHTSSRIGKLQVSADSNAMRGLCGCGGLSVEEIAKNPKLHQTLAVSMMDELLEERTPLQWRLQPSRKGDCNYDLVKVFGLKLNIRDS